MAFGRDFEDFGVRAELIAERCEADDVPPVIEAHDRVADARTHIGYLHLLAVEHLDLTGPSGC